MTADMTKHGVELFYSCGGHGGPYWTMEEAREAAARRLTGMPSMCWVDIVERDPIAIGGYGNRIERIRQKD